MRFLNSFAAVAVLAAQPAAADPTAHALAAGPVQALKSYPAAAEASGTDGQATLKCERTERSALADCGLVVETPAGQGFGVAALDLAARSADGCGPPVPLAQRAPRYIRLSFQAASRAITPDVTRPGWLIGSPNWARLPSANDFGRYYPEREMRVGVSGEVTLQCVAAANAHMSNCEVIHEAPESSGFGAAALQVSTFFVIDRSTCGGRYAGATLVLPIRFAVPQD